jgi:hypothetical protein
MTTSPNPTSDMLNMDMDLNMVGRAEMTVMDLLGQEARVTTTLPVAPGCEPQYDRLR